jgi:hypothetical protein
MYSTGETHIKGMIGNGMRVLGILTNICIGGTIDLVAIAA